MVAFQFGVLYDFGEADASSTAASESLVIAFVSSSIGGCVGRNVSVDQLCRGVTMGCARHRTCALLEVDDYSFRLSNHGHYSTVVEQF